MTDSTTSIQAWETIETTDAITAEQYSSVVESFSSHYHTFLGYQPGEEDLWRSGAAGGQFSEDSPRQPFWSHPLAKTGMLGASGLAATLLVGVALSETANNKTPSFTFREPILPSQLDLSKDQSAGSTVPQSSVSPAAPSVEFSNTQGSSMAASTPSKADELAEVDIPQLIQSPGRWNLPNRPMLDDAGLTARISRPSVTNSPLPAAAMPETRTQEAARPDLPSPDLTQSSADRTRLAPTEVADASQSPMLGVLERLPMLEEADPEEMGNTPSAANPGDEAPVAPASGAPSASNNPAIYPGAETLPLPMQPPLPSNSVDGSEGDARQAKLSFEQLPMLAIAEPMPTTPTNAIAPEPSPFPVQPSVEFEQPNGTERFLSDRSLSFSQQTAATPNVLTYYPVFEATVQSAVQLVAIAATQPDDATQIPVSVTAATPNQSSTPNVTKASPTLNSLRDFLNYKRVPSGYTARVMPLSRQAATEVQRTDTVEQFRIFQLSTREYQTAWVIRNGAIGQQATTPTYGFIDYQRQMIVVPDVS